MRVAILTCVYPPYGGGMGYVAQAQARELAQEHEVTVFMPRYERRTTPAPTPGVSLVALRPLGTLGNAAPLPQLAWRLRGFDVVHLHYPFFGVQEWLRLVLRKPQRLVVTYHMVPQAGGAKGVVFRMLARLVERQLARRAALLFTQTRDFLDQVALPRLGQPGRWRVLPLGVADQFTPGSPPAHLERELHVGHGEPVVLFVGSLDAAHAFKGVEVLLEAAAQLAPLRFKLVVVGRGNRRPRYERRARELKLGRRTAFVGYVPEAALVGYLRAASVLVLPSTTGAETFGLVLLQALACGVPVVASRLPGVREVVQETGGGLLVTPGEATSLAAALEHLLTSPATARELGQRGAAAVAARYRWSAIGARLRELYRTEL